jgi:hydroxymethylbilane synthase
MDLDLTAGLRIEHPPEHPTLRVPPHHPALPLRVGTRASPLALAQSRSFVSVLTLACPFLGATNAFQEHAMRTTGDRVQDRRLAEIGGKGLFAKEIHEALLQRRIDLAVHSLKDLETELPPGISLACVLKREDARDALLLRDPIAGADPTDPLFSALPQGALVGTSSVRRQAQLLHARPDLRVTMLRGNVQTRLAKLQEGECDASLLALAGLRRLGLEDEAAVVLDPAAMVPAAGQGIVGITAREDDEALRELLAIIEDTEAREAATAERTMLAVLDGSCRTPIGAYAQRIEGGRLRLTGLVAREDGGFLLRRTVEGVPADAERMGQELGASLRADSPAAIFA